MLFYWSQVYLSGYQNKEEKLPEKLHNTKLGFEIELRKSRKERIKCT